MQNTQQNNYNLTSIDVSSNKNTESNKYFNNYFGPKFQVSTDVDAAIISYFESVTDNRESAKILASAVIYTSYTRNVDPMTILKEFTGLPPGELNSYLTMFLNLQRVGTSFLGITSVPLTNKYVQRSILP